MRLQQAIDRSLSDKILPFVGEANRQLSRRQLRKLQRQVDDLAADIVRDAIPDPVRSRAVICQCLNAALAVAIVPSIKRGAGMPSLSNVRLAGKCDCSTNSMISAFTDAGYLMPRPPHLSPDRGMRSIHP
jgi:hypothetical protein